jgi:FkbM family methyltransferase
MSDLQQLKKLAEDFAAAAGAYGKIRDEAHSRRLRAIRNQIVAVLLDDPTIGSNRAAVSSLLSVAVSAVNTGIRAFPRTASENALWTRALSSMTEAAAVDAAAGRALPALLMAWHACELKFLPPIASFPDAALPAWIMFLLERPPIFMNKNDAGDFATHLASLCARVSEHVRQSGKYSRELAALFIGSNMFVQSIFNELNLRDTMRARGALIELILERSGATVDQLRVLRPIRARPRIGFAAVAVADNAESAFLAAHMDRLDLQKYEIRLYTFHEPIGRLGAVCRGALETYVRLPANLPEAVARLRSDDLDMAIFATNLSCLNQLFTQIAAHRVARIQVSTIASPVTTGLRNMDVMLSGELNETTDSPKQYTESLICLPGALNCYPFQYAVEGLPPVKPMSRPEVGIRDDVTLFMSTSNYFKLLPEVTEQWFKILQHVPGSSLALMPFGPNWSSDYPTDLFLTRLTRQAADAGLSADRIHVLRPAATIAHLHRVLQLADVYLDSFPFSGACSIFDALEVGLPIVARSGGVCRSRHSKAILEEMGLADWVSTDGEGYLKRAVELGRSAAKRQDARDRLARARKTGFPLTDTASYAAKLTAVFDRMFVDWNRNVEQARAQAPGLLAERIAQLSVAAGEGMSSFTDLDLVASILLPYLRTGGNRRMIDVGACVGAVAKPFLEEGWRVVMFEPDPRCRQQLAALAAAHADRARVEPAAVTIDRGASAAFHLASVPGLSGLSTSPYAADVATIDVATVDLPAYMATHGLLDVDFIKIDVEGHDFAVLRGIDFARATPRVVMVEFGDQFAGQDRNALDALLRHMRDARYRACVVCLHASGRFELHQWQTRLQAIGVDDVPELPAAARLFGNIVFFREDERDLLPSVLDWLEHVRKWQGHSNSRTPPSYQASRAT